MGRHGCGELIHGCRSLDPGVTNDFISGATVSVSQVLDATTGVPSMINDVQTIFSGKASMLDKIMAAGDLALNVAMDVIGAVGWARGCEEAEAPSMRHAESRVLWRVHGRSNPR